MHHGFGFVVNQFARFHLHRLRLAVFAAQVQHDVVIEMQLVRLGIVGRAVQVPSPPSKVNETGLSVTAWPLSLSKLMPAALMEVSAWSGSPLAGTSSVISASPGA